MRGPRELPDTKIVPFPDNYRGDDSPAAHRATWGPDHDVQPMTAGEVVLVGRGKTIATFTLHVVLKRGLGFYLRGCRLVQWGPGQRVFLPERKTTVKIVSVSDDDDEKLFTVVNSRDYYEGLLRFDSNRGAKAFEEAALAAARYAVEQHRDNQREAPAVDYGDTADDVPF